MAPTMANLKKLAASHGGSVEPDGCGGYEVLAPTGRRWIDGEVQCLVLPLPEYETAAERTDEIRRAMDLILNGHEHYPD